MKKRFILVIALFVIALAAPASIRASAPASKCEDTDRDCKEFEQMLDAQQPDKVIARYEAAKTAQYSAVALRYVGDAYLLLASREDITPEQELGYYQKALGVKHYIAYMGLYFFYAQKDEEKALGFLREYVKTGPKDTVHLPDGGVRKLEMLENRFAVDERHGVASERERAGISENLDAGTRLDVEVVEPRMRPRRPSAHRDAPRRPGRRFGHLPERGFRLGGPVDPLQGRRDGDAHRRVALGANGLRGLLMHAYHFFGGHDLDG